jgi:hypothetical protein
MPGGSHQVSLPENFFPPLQRCGKWLEFNENRNDRGRVALPSTGRADQLSSRKNIAASSSMKR